MTHVLKVDLTVSVILRPYLEMRIEPEVGVRVLFVPAPRWLAAFCRLVCFNHTHNVDVQVLHKIFNNQRKCHPCSRKAC